MFCKYNSIIEKLSEVKTFDLNVLTSDNFIMKRGVTRDGDFDFPKGHYNHIFLSYVFTYKNNFYILVLEDDIQIGFIPLLDYWEDYIDPFTSLINERDTDYIKNIKKYRLFEVDIKTMSKLDQLDEFCELELIRIRPMLRRKKIENLLK